MMIPRETQDFASLLGWRQHIFSTKQAALDNMKSKLSLLSLALFLYHEEYLLKSEKHVQTINTNLTA